MKQVGCSVGVVFALVTVAAASGQAPYSKKLMDDAPGVHGFSVALVLGDFQGGAAPENMPNGARKALTDMRDFLPYKGYRLLDTQWILCCGSSKIGTGVSGRLRGMSQAGGSDEQEYSFTVTVLGVSGSQLSVRFLMTDTGSSAAKKNFGWKPEHEAGDKETQRQVEEILRAAGGVKGAVIDSTFSMDIGETVVIGTSSLKGNKALIALLTAARRPGTQSSTLGEKR